MNHWRALLCLACILLLSSCTTARNSPPKNTAGPIGCIVSEQTSSRVAILVAKLQYEKALKDPAEFSYMHLPADQVLAKLRQDYDDALKTYQFWENHVRKYGHIHNFSLDTTTKRGQPDTTPSAPGIPPSKTAQP